MQYSGKLFLIAAAEQRWAPPPTLAVVHLMAQDFPTSLCIRDLKAPRRIVDLAPACVVDAEQLEPLAGLLEDGGQIPEELNDMARGEQLDGLFNAFLRIVRVAVE